MVRSLGIILFIVLGSVQLVAQGSFRFYVKANKKTITLSETVQLTYKFEGGAPSEFIPPSLKNFQFASYISQGHETQIINNRISKAKTFKFTLKPNKMGTFTIPPATVTVNGKKLLSDEITIKVVDKSDQEKDIYRQIKENLFIKAYLSKNEVYVGEQVKVTYKMFKRVDISELNYKSVPAFDGFWKEVLNDKKDFQLSNEQVDGKNYQTGILESVILFPQKTGDIVIDPYVLETRIPVKTRSQRYNSIFDDVFGSYKNYEYDLRSPSLKLKVKPLPPGRPANFSGLVGSFDFSATLTTSKLEVNDPVTLNVTVKGKGNLKLLEPWVFDYPSGIEDHPPQTHDNITKSGGILQGSRRYEYLMIPYRDGMYKLPPVNFNYFDVERGKYQNFSSGELVFQVGKGQDLANITSNPNGGMKTGVKNDVNFINEDIRFIKFNNLSLRPLSFSHFGSVGHVVLSTMPLFLFGLLILMRRKKEVDEQDVIGTRKKRATTLAKKRLKSAKSLLDKGEPSLFYEEVSRAALGYLCDKFNIPMAEMSKDRATTVLLESGIEPDLVDKVGRLLDECEFARFAPGDTYGKMDTVYADAVAVISQIESIGKQ